MLPAVNHRFGLAGVVLFLLGCNTPVASQSSSSGGPSSFRRHQFFRARIDERRIHRPDFDGGELH